MSQEMQGMKDRNKTKEQLIDELVELRRRVAEFEASEAERRRLGQKQGVKIGEILMEMGYLTKLQLNTSLRKQKEAEMLVYMLEHKHKRLGEIMVESGIITKEQLHSALEEQQARIDRWQK